MSKYEEKKKDMASKMICANRSCKNEKHGHSWMKSRGKVVK